MRYLFIVMLAAAPISLAWAQAAPAQSADAAAGKAAATATPGFGAIDQNLLSAQSLTFKPGSPEDLLLQKADDQKWGLYVTAVIIGLLLELSLGHHMEIVPFLRRAVLIGILLTFYKAIFGTIINNLGDIAAWFAPKAGALSTYTAAASAARGTVADGNLLTAGVLWASGVIYDSAVHLIIAAAEAIAYVIILTGKILTAMFFILGPIALPLGVPRKSGVAALWFKELATFASWPIFIGLALSLLVATGVSAYTGAIGALVSTLALAISVGSAPMIAGRLVGGAIGNVSAALHGKAGVGGATAAAGHAAQIATTAWKTGESDGRRGGERWRFGCRRRRLAPGPGRRARPFRLSSYPVAFPGDRYGLCSASPALSVAAGDLGGLRASVVLAPLGAHRPARLHRPAPAHRSEALGAAAGVRPRRRRHGRRCARPLQPLAGRPLASARGEDATAEGRGREVRPGLPASRVGGEQQYHRGGLAGDAQLHLAGPPQAPREGGARHQDARRLPGGGTSDRHRLRAARDPRPHLVHDRGAGHDAAHRRASRRARPGRSAEDDGSDSERPGARVLHPHRGQARRARGRRLARRRAHPHPQERRAGGRGPLGPPHNRRPT